MRSQEGPSIWVGGAAYGVQCPNVVDIVTWRGNASRGYTSKTFLQFNCTRYASLISAALSYSVIRCRARPPSLFPSLCECAQEA